MLAFSKISLKSTSEKLGKQWEKGGENLNSQKRKWQKKSLNNYLHSNRTKTRQSVNIQKVWNKYNKCM